MTRDTTDTIPSAAGRCILPLPDDVVAQIKSSTAIVSLTAVILDLLKNSLDARATRVEATVDFARGGCTIEDDGLGIPPPEFREEGGLGKLYCTSKYHATEALLGRHGTFLASLAAMSLLTVTSHHHDYRSHNSITFHHGKAVERQLPAAAHHQVHGKHGTRVTVRNLFGNLPVRVKQRSMVSEQRPEQERLWVGLKRELAGLLLGWQGSVSLRVRDGDNRLVLNFNASNSATVGKHQKSDVAKPRSPHLSSLLNILTQANYIAVDEWPSWVPVSASTSALSIKGAISLEPAPSKHVQFISLGIRSLSPDTGHNELYDEVNRLFALSSFGTIEDDADVDELEKTRRQADKRFKKDGYTNRQLKARKDVDRYPMFHLRISLKESPESNLSEDRLIDDEANLQNVMEILGAMITQWLSVHHFRPRQPRKNRIRPGTASSAFSDSTENASAWERRATPVVQHGVQSSSQVETPKRSSLPTTTRKRKRSDRTTAKEPSGKLQSRAFAEWSRIKSAKPEFFDKPPPSLKLVDRTDPVRLLSNEANTSQRAEGENFASFQVEPIPQGALSVQPAREEANPSALIDTPRFDDDKNDDTIMWTDPSTKKTYLLNARTGCVVPDNRPRPNTGSSVPTLGIIQKDMNKSMWLPSRASTAVPRETPWLDDVLQNWDNPVFKPAEQRIPQVALHEQAFDHGHANSHHGCSRLDMDKAFTEASPSSSNKLSKESLKNAQFISQVDKKFILVKMQPSSHAEALLVLIDQHAADERVRVETLFRELCTPLPHTSSQAAYQSKLGHTSQIPSILLEKSLQFTISAQERTHLTTHAARFAAWGILYDILTPTTATPSTAKEKHVLSVSTLPPQISSRCTSDPNILISLLRSTVWKWTSDPPPFLPQSSTPNNETKQNDWVRHLATCPTGLIDLINSRACRSAIMFNDELSTTECEALVAQLANCIFPFMCAHGRPSMVPLVQLGGALGGVEEGKGGEKGFVQAWRVWKR